MQIAKAEPRSKQLRKQAGAWLKDLRGRAGLSQIQLADVLGFKYYTFISQVENGFGRVPVESMEAWAKALGAEPQPSPSSCCPSTSPSCTGLLFEVKK